MGFYMKLNLYTLLLTLGTILQLSAATLRITNRSSNPLFLQRTKEFSRQILQGNLIFTDHCIYNPVHPDNSVTIEILFQDSILSHNQQSITLQLGSLEVVYIVHPYCRANGTYSYVEEVQIFDNHHDCQLNHISCGPTIYLELTVSPQIECSNPYLQGKTVEQVHTDIALQHKKLSPAQYASRRFNNMICALQDFCLQAESREEFCTLYACVENVAKDNKNFLKKLREIYLPLKENTPPLSAHGSPIS